MSIIIENVKNVCYNSNRFFEKIKLNDKKI